MHMATYKETIKAYNDAIAQGLDEDAAMEAAGITDATAGYFQTNDIGNPRTNPDFGKLEKAGFFKATDIALNRQVGATRSTPLVSTSKPEIDEDDDDEVAFQQAAQRQGTTTPPSTVRTITTTTTTTTGGGSTTTVRNPTVKLDTPASIAAQQQADAAAAARTALIAQLKAEGKSIGAASRDPGVKALTAQRNAAQDQADDLKVPVPGTGGVTVTQTPNTTTVETVYSTSSPNFLTQNAGNEDQTVQLSELEQIPAATNGNVVSVTVGQENPYEQSRLEAESAFNVDFAETQAQEDPYEQSRLDAEAAFNADFAGTQSQENIFDGQIGFDNEEISDTDIKEDPYALDVDPYGVENEELDPATFAENQPVATESVFDPRQEITESVFDPGPVATNNPWAGVDAEKAAAWDNLSPADQEYIGNADPTDEFLLMRAPDGGNPVAVTSPADVDVGAGNNPDEINATTAPEPVELTEEERTRLEAEAAFNEDAAAQKEREQQEAEQAAAKAAALDKARAQNTIAEQRGNKNNADWRVKLRLAPLADYLYKAPNSGILSPLLATDGVLFPYTPTINTSYKANYSAVDITHSNYKGYFYQGSSVEPVIISCPFTAQSTSQAEYLLAVIHFFKSVTKMFYGQDPQRGSPPPLVYLTGLGEFQFNEHPCVVTSFTYDLPADVDYIRAYSPNVNNSNMLQQRQSNNSTGPGTSWGGGILGGFVGGAINRLASSKLANGQSMPAGGENTQPAPPTLASTTIPTYVPTKMNINITLLPVVSRQAQSQRFSVRQYANGDLLKGGMW